MAGMSTSQAPSGDLRLAGVDSFRVLAALAVVVGHGFSDFKVLGELYPESIIPALYFYVHDLTHPAVPFFLIASGFFFARSIRGGASPWRLLSLRTMQLGLIFLAWSYLYRVIPAMIENDPDEGLLLEFLGSSLGWVKFAVANPIELAFGEAAEHLWFVPSLIVAWSCMVLLHSWGRTGLAVPLGLVAYALVMVATAYQNTPIGVEGLMQDRGNPLFCLLFTALGWHFAFVDKIPTIRIATWIALAGLAMALLEVQLLRTFFGLSYSARAYFGTVPITIGLLLVALNLPDFGRRSALASMGRLTLGIYLIHVLLYWELERFKYSVSPVLWDLGIDLFVFGVSAGLTWVLMQTPLTAALVSGLRLKRQSPKPQVLVEAG